MASDEIVWDIINNQFCSYKVSTVKEQSFCRNEYNVSGYCSKQHCPLSNSRYATIRIDRTTGRLYLYTKTVERAHMPNRWWERVRLPANYNKALQMIDERLTYWPKFFVHKCKQRLTRLTQVAIRTQLIEKEEARLGERTVPKLAPKVRSREQTRERKAQAAAKVERAIERELIDRLKSGAYRDRPLNVEEDIWKKVLRSLERTGDEIHGEELDDESDNEEQGYNEELEYEHDGDLVEVEYISDNEALESDDADVDDLEDWLGSKAQENVVGDEDNHSDQEISTEGRKRTGTSRRRERGVYDVGVLSKQKKGPRRGIEYEMEKAELEIPQVI